MAQLSKKELLEEAKKQSEMLERIGRWRTYSMIVSAIGVAVAYMGFTGSFYPIAVGAAGVVIILAGLGFAAFCNFGIRTGRENVERILTAAERSE